MGKTKYQPKWQDGRSWLRAGKGNVYGAFCSSCNCTLNVTAGVSTIQKHEKNTKHIENVKVLENNQTKFVPAGSSSSSSSPTLFFSSKKKVVLNNNQQLWNAVIIRALNVVDKGYSFNSTNGDNELYQWMFPDS